MTPKHLQIKRRHHYVWARHLKNWSNGSGNVYYVTKKGRIAHDSIRSIMASDYFYKTSHLSEKHIQLYKALSKKSSQVLQEQHARTLESFLEIQRISNLYELINIKDKEGSLAIEALRCNTLENMHSQYENDAREVIDQLLNGDTSALEGGEKLFQLMNFMGHQISRTIHFKETALQSLSTSESMVNSGIRDTMEQSWWLLSHMFGSNLGYSLYASSSQTHQALLVNNSKTPFITSDQPIINIHACTLSTEKKPPNEADFYYPISPKKAIVICDSDRFPLPCNYIDHTTAEELNTKLALAAKAHIVGDNSEAINPYKKFISQSKDS